MTGEGIAEVSWQRVQLQNTGQLSRWLVEAQAQPYSYECA